MLCSKSRAGNQLRTKWRNQKGLNNGTHCRKAGPGSQLLFGSLYHLCTRGLQVFLDSTREKHRERYCTDWRTWEKTIQSKTLLMKQKKNAVKHLYEFERITHFLTQTEQHTLYCELHLQFALSRIIGAVMQYNPTKYNHSWRGKYVSLFIAVSGVSTSQRVEDFSRVNKYLT